MIKRYFQNKHLVEVILRGSVAFVTRGGGFVVSYVLGIWIARQFGADGVGIYGQAVSVLTIGAVFGYMGLNQALTRYLAPLAAASKWASIRMVSWNALRFTLLISILVAVILFLLSPWIAIDILSEPRMLFPLRVMTLTVVPFSLLRVCEGLFKGIKQTFIATLAEGAIVPVGICVILLFGYFIVPELTIEHVSAAYLVSTALTAFSLIMYWRWMVPQAGVIVIDKALQTNILKAAWPIMSIDLMVQIRSRLDLLLIGYWGTSAAVGIYSTAVRMVLITGFLLDSAEVILAPKIANLYANNDFEELQKLITNVVRLLLLISIGVYSVFLAAPNLILSIFGDEFGEGATIMRIVSVAMFFQVASGPTAMLLLMTGYEKKLRNILIVTVVLSVALNFFLIPTYGALGAAITTAFAIFLSNGWSIYEVRQQTGIHMSPFR